MKQGKRGREDSNTQSQKSSKKARKDRSKPKRISSGSDNYSSVSDNDSDDSDDDDSVTVSTRSSYQSSHKSRGGRSHSGGSKTFTKPKSSGKSGQSSKKRASENNQAPVEEFEQLEEPYDEEGEFKANNKISGGEGILIASKIVTFANDSKSRVRNVHLLKSVLKVKSDSKLNSEDIWFVDSGTKQSLTPHAECVITADSTADTLPALRTIDGSQLPATGIGTRLPGVLTNVAICPTAADQLAAVSELQSNGFSVIFPANKKGGVITNTDGKVVLDIDEDSATNLSMYNRITPTLYYTLTVTDRNADELTRVYRISGLTKDLPPEDRVYIQYLVGHFSKEQMIFLSGSVINYPVTREEIELYYPLDKYIEMAAKKPRLPTKATKSKVKVEEQAEKMKQLSKPKYKAEPKSRDVADLINLKKIEARNLTIGYQVGLDFFGPILSISLLSIVDKASGYYFCEAIKKSATKDHERAVRVCINHYARHGHHSKEWKAPIKEARLDEDPKFLSANVASIFEQNGIETTFSPPHEHQFNGLAEGRHRIMIGETTCNMAQSPWVSESLWIAAWNFSRATRNLLPSLRPGYDSITREEDFTGKKPDFNKQIYLPWGMPVLYPISPGSKTIKFSVNQLPGMYMGVPLVLNPR